MMTPEDKLREYFEYLIELGDVCDAEHRLNARTSVIAIENALSILEIKIPGVNSK